MLFNSLDFIIFFIVVLSIVVIVKNRKFQHVWLLLVSYFFFYYTSNYLITLLILSTLLDFYVAKEIGKSNSIKNKKILLSLSLSGNLGLLGFFKYADFSISQFNLLGTYLGFSEIPYLNLALPIGISFYTFQTISYTVDVYRGILTPSKSLKEFALFVSFFPQLVAGPIVRASTFLPQLREKINSSNLSYKIRQITLQKANLKYGITLMAFGFFKKMFFADNIAPLVNDIFTAPIGSESFTIIIGAFAFGVQIYCDFSGYSDIAIGAALVMGFQFPLNFNKPYFALSPSDFWRRWHISLSTWLRDYLYIPLGGNRKSHKRTYFNLMSVMFLGGLWHGASWNFVVWGLLHGSYLAIHKFLIDRFPFLSKIKFFKTIPGKIFSIIVTQYLVFLTWITFRVEDFDNMVYSVQKYVIIDFKTTQTINVINDHKLEVFLLVLFFVIHLISYLRIDWKFKIVEMRLTFWFLFLVGTMVSILLLYDGNPIDFVYFKF